MTTPNEFLFRTPKTKLPFLTRLRLALRRRKPNADDNIERPEPDRLFGVFQDFIFGIVLTAFFMMIAYAFMTDIMAEWIGTFLAAQNNAFNFEERLAAFTSVLIALINLVVIFGVALTRIPDNEDLVDAVGDLGEEIDERFMELEHEVHTGHESLRSMIDDLTPGTIDDKTIKERLGL